VAKPTLRAIAAHEAAHVVVGAHVGARRPRVASIVPDETDGTLGHLRANPFPDPSRFEADRALARRRLEPEIVRLCAGTIAERRLAGQRYDWLGATSDMEKAYHLIAFCVASERQGDAYGRFLWVMTEDLVEQLASEIEFFAEQLLERPTIRDRDLRDVLAAATRAGSPAAAGPHPASDRASRRPA
jgi:hypothetical protein